MIYLIALLVACTVGLLTAYVVQSAYARPRAVSDQLAEIELLENPFSSRRRRERREVRERVEKMLAELGQRFEQKPLIASRTREMLIQAGYRHHNAPAIYQGLRVAAPVSVFVLTLLLLPQKGGGALVIGMGLAAMLWTLPVFYVGGRRKRRQQELQKALADMLDMLVVCVEAGLGLNQAMVRVADEIRHASPLMSEELILTNLEIRAGSPREEALRNLGYRTGVSDIRSLVAMLIQTERFGTSVGQALRVQASTLREKRKQRADELVNQMAIQMLFPLVFCIFPAMFVLTLGPAVIQIAKAFGDSPF